MWKKVMDAGSQPITYVGITNDKKIIYRVNKEGKIVTSEWKSDYFLSNRPANEQEIALVEKAINAKVQEPIPVLIQDPKISINEEKAQKALWMILKLADNAEEFNDLVTYLYGQREIFKKPM